MARFNRRVINPLAAQAAGAFPPYAVLEHRGRRSGRLYRSPLVALPTRDGVLIALTFGSGSDWVRNVRAAGAARLRYAGRWRDLDRPVILGPRDALPLTPAPLRLMLRLIGFRESLHLALAQHPRLPAGSAAGPPSKAKLHARP